ncbi:hypothetical protein N7G274_009027 [Stereocaulon virgatum]|uniref:Fungal N-terminal domain-containing protein n=1 Tax=Stereocaulon virgatum TaxID=373712 RepID=A0ABR4A084_9LECA
MSIGFGFSLSDIVLSYQLAAKVYDRCFTRANGADIRYASFGKQIKLLEDSLRTLESVVANADKQLQLPRRPWHNDADRFGPSVEVLSEVAGDFKKTLEECDALLKDHSKFQYSQAGFIENVIWWSSVEGDVNNLKERVRFHMMKLTFVAKPFEIQLLLGIKHELQELRKDVNEIKTILVNGLQNRDTSSSAYLQSFQVPDELARRFADSLQLNAPPSFQIQGELPLKDIFDALVYHFADSTIEFNPRPEMRQRAPDEPQYLNLVKARWIADVIKGSDTFQLAGPDSLWADYLKELEDDIKGQFRRFDTGQLVPPSPDRIALLPDSSFSIWVAEAPPVRPPDLAEPRPLEEKILELALPGTFGTRQSTVTVFRKSESKIRLVKTTKDDQNQYFHHEVETPLNIDSDRLIPTYATPSDPSTATNNVMLCNVQGQDPIWYSLKDAADVLHFQRALTGFRVSHHILNISWSIEGSSKPSKSGKGSVQFWHLKPFQPIGEDGERTLDTSSMSTRSPQSPTPSGALTRNSTGLSATTTLFSTGSIASTVNGPRGDGTALLCPEVPRIVIFTSCEGMYTFLQFKIDTNLFINLKGTKSKTTVVIETKAKRIDFVKLSVKELNSWNLACFRYPRHPEMRKLETTKQGSEAASKIMEITSKKYIVLTFTGPKEKEEFCAEFDMLARLRDVDQSKYTRTLMEKKHQADNPGARGLLQPQKYQLHQRPAGSLEMKSSVNSTMDNVSPRNSQAISFSSSANAAPCMEELHGNSIPIPELSSRRVYPELSSRKVNTELSSYRM